MKAIIPMAGSGTRLRPLTHSKPKALLRVGSKPILAHIIDRLLPTGCRELVPIISEEGGKIPLYIKKHYPDIKIDTIIQKEKLGLGHAVRMAEKICRDTDIIIIYGDTIIDSDMTGIIDESVDGVIAVREVEDPCRFGVVNVTEGIISKFVEKPSKPESNLAIVGLNYIKNSNALFDCLNEIIGQNKKTRGEYQITDAFQLMVERGLRMKPFTVDGWFDAGTKKTLLETNRFMLKRDGNRESLEGSIILPPVFIPDNAIITNSIIGPDVSVGDNTLIAKSIISNSIVGSETKVINVSLKDSLIGDNVEIYDRPRIFAIGDHSSIEFNSDK